MKGFMSQDEVKKTKEQYPVGTRIELDNMFKENDMPNGIQGEVRYVDDAGQVGMKWDNSRSLSLIPNEDSFHIVREKEDKIKVLVVAPKKEPYVVEIENNRKAIKKALAASDVSAISYDDKDISYHVKRINLIGAKVNRSIGDGEGNKYRNPIYGKFLISGKDRDSNTCSLTDEQIETYSKRFQLEKIVDMFKNNISEKNVTMEWKVGQGKASALKDKLIVLVVEAQKTPFIMAIENDYKAMQKLVGGCIEYVALPDGECHLYCNDEGKLDGLAGNRRMDNGDIISGTFFICGSNSESDDISLTDEQIAHYTERFRESEHYSQKEANHFTYEVTAAKDINEFLKMMGITPQADGEMER